MCEMREGKSLQNNVEFVHPNDAGDPCDDHPY